MLRLITLSIFSTCYLSAALATPNLNLAASAFADEVPFHLSYTSMDLDYGKDVELLFNELSKNKLQLKTINNLSKYQNKPHAFLILNPIYNRLKLITSISDQDSFYSSCEIFSKNINTFTDSINDRLNISIDTYCRNLFLKRLTGFSGNSNFSSRDLAYFNGASPFFVNGENQHELVMLLRHFKFNAVEQEKLSNILIEKYIELQIKPPSNILSFLKINTKFNNFLQNNLNLDNNTNNYFQDEFRNLYRVAQDHADKGEAQDAISRTQMAIKFYENNQKYINMHKAWINIIRIGKALFYKNQDADALKIFELAKSVATLEDYSESFYYLLWPHLVNKDYKAMKAAVDKNGLEKNFEKFDSKLQYWIASSFIKTGDISKGTALLSRIISNTSYSFYSIIALKELASLKKANVSEAEIMSKLISNEIPLEIELDKASDKLKDSLKRLAVWNKIGNERFATLELRYIQFLSKDNTFKDIEYAKKVSPQIHKEFLIVNLIRLLNSQKRFITSFKIFQDSLEQNPLSLNYKLIKFIFPLSYIELIKKNALNLDPLIIISLIRQESAFNPEARSGVGAKGLMQLMPATAKRFNRKIKVSHLEIPDINVAIGTKYLRQLISRFDGNLIFALASYNAGENRIDRWRKEIFRNDDPLSTIESIPFEETRNYVKFIYRNNFFYSLLSNKSVLMIPLEETFKVNVGANSF